MEEKTCSNCKLSKPKEQYSLTQWKKTIRYCYSCQKDTSLNQSVAKTTQPHSEVKFTQILEDTITIDSNKPVEQWSVEQVVKWAKTIEGIQQSDAEDIGKQRVNGKALLKLNAASLERWGIPVGPAMIIADEIEKLKGPTQQVLDDTTFFQEVKRRKLNLPFDNEDPFLPLFQFLQKIYAPKLLDEGSIIELPKEIYQWFNGSDHPMLIRKSYVELFTKCEQLSKGGYHGVLITGNPGIGKSFFLFYCLLKYVFELKKTVFFQLLKNQRSWEVTCDSFKPVEASFDKITKVDVYLFDAGIPRREPFDVKQTFTIVSSSPNRNNFQGWMKDGDKYKLYMPCWNETEIQKINDAFHHLQTDELFSQIYHYNGIPRYLFSKNSELIQNEQQQALQNCEPTNIKNCITNYTFDDDISHKIIKIEVNDDNYTKCYYTFASKYVEETFPKVLVTKGFDQALGLVKTTLRDFPDAASLRGNLFGQLAHSILSAGGQFQTSGGCLQIPKLYNIKLNKTLQQIQNSDLGTNCYIIPTQKNFAVFDSFYRRENDCLLAFQFTVSTSHSYDDRKVEVLVDNLNLKSLEVYFVVPSDIYDHFTLPKGQSVDGFVKFFKLSLWNDQMRNFQDIYSQLSQCEKK